MGSDKMPGKVSPMLCTLIRELPELSEYLYEMKWLKKNAVILMQINHYENLYFI